MLTNQSFQLFRKVQFSSVAQSCLTLCDPMNPSMSGPPVHHQLPEFTQTHVNRVRQKSLSNLTTLSSVQFTSAAQSCPILCDCVNFSTPDLPVHHQLLEFTQTHIH